MMTNRFLTLVRWPALLMLAVGLAGACTSASEDAYDEQIGELQRQVQDLEEQLQQALAAEPEALGRPTIVVIPPILRFPRATLQRMGAVWFNVSGLEPNQWFRVTVADEELATVLGRAESELVLVNPESLIQANAVGGYAGTLLEIRSGRGLSDKTAKQGGVVTVSLRDADTEALLATAPWVICGSELENLWCAGAEDPLPAEAPEAPEDFFLRMVEEFGLLVGEVAYRGIVYELDRFQVEDDLFQLRMAGEPYWGYAVEERINGTEGDGIVMTINLGDTLRFSRLGTSGSRTTKPHFLTITGLEIEVDVGPGVRIEPWELKPDKVGEFVIDDRSDPGKHGKVLLIVNEPPDGSG